MIRRIGRIEILELAVAPIVVAAVHDDATNGSAVSANELGGGVRDDVRAPFKRAEEIRRSKGVIDKQDQLVLVGDLRNFLEREDRDIGVA